MAAKTKTPIPKRSPKTGGRRSKLTAELLDTICKCLHLHNTVKTACDLVGISQQTFYMWMNEGEIASRGIKRDFYESIKRAQSQSKITLVSAIHDDKSWQAKAWILERCHHKEFGRRQTLEHSTPEDAPAVRVEGSVSPVQIIVAAAGDMWSDDDDAGTEAPEEAAEDATEDDKDEVVMPGSTQDEV